MNQMNKRSNFKKQSMAWFLLVVFVFQLVYPTTVVYAGGPSQPEVQGFAPIEMKDMVDPFTGDFKYNIPLMNVEGYPLNIAYNSGISVDQEATWVGLGWTLNTGSLVRNLRGLPDDFNGDIIEKMHYTAPTIGINVNTDFSIEFFGFDEATKKIAPVGGGSLKLGLGVGYNNYTGFNSSVNLGASFDIAKTNSHKLAAGFSLSGSSENGASFSPNVSFEKKMGTADKMGFTIGAGMNSRSGLNYLSFQGSYQKTVEKTRTNTTVDEVTKETKTVEEKYNSTSSRALSTSFNMGLSQYSPTAGSSTESYSLTGSLNGGFTVYGVDGQLTGTLSFSRQAVPKYLRTIKNPAFGYFFLGNAGSPNALMDFNRDNDGSFTKYTPFLPSAHLTNDLFSVNAQGTGGSFRGYRTDIGYVKDPTITNNGTSGSIGFEFGAGGLTDIGVDLTFVTSYSRSGCWLDKNYAANDLKFKKDNSGLNEPFAFRDASERSLETNLPEQLKNPLPYFFPVGGLAISPKLENSISPAIGTSKERIPSFSADRLKRNNALYFLSVEEVRKGYGIYGVKHFIPDVAKNHHIGEVTQLGVDGKRYVFGMPVYNTLMEEYTFAVGDNIKGNGGLAPTDLRNGILTYSEKAATKLLSDENDRGIDNFYLYKKTPAYAHSFMLTSVLSDDYSDIDNIPGPSKDDLGTYVSFDYTNVDGMNWRNPMPKNTAFFVEGLKTDKKDDKASFTYGTKDQRYLKKISTKNYVAVFFCAKRRDGGHITDNKGGLDDTKTSLRLEKILLFTREVYEKNEQIIESEVKRFNGTFGGTKLNESIHKLALQAVHFEYNYALCPKYQGNKSQAPNDGKLTLQKIYFTYQGSYKMVRNPYKFEYDSNNNPEYNSKSIDRWGNYKPNLKTGSKAVGYGTKDFDEVNESTADFPYTPQDETANTYAAAWSLKTIYLPNGGKIVVDYEADDYAFVQDKRASVMKRIRGIDSKISNGQAAITKDSKLLFELDPVPGNPSKFYPVSDYVKVGQELYFRCYTNMIKGLSVYEGYEYISGYGTVESINELTIDGKQYGLVKLLNETLKDNSFEANPITKAAILIARTQMSRYLKPRSNLNDPKGESEADLKSFFKAIGQAFKSLGEIVTGPNIPYFDDGVGRNIVMNKSFIRVIDATGHKKGGGVRVKKIELFDNWDIMSGSSGFSYGQEYSYNYPNGMSSGVASYEPELGGDENTWHQPIKYTNKKMFAVDDNLFLETPVMESLFPSPTVGYAHVTIKNLERSGIEESKTGYVVKEFYTQRDYPTFVQRSDIDLKPSVQLIPIGPKYQFLTASQGFSIELNDMHGKPKRELVYPEIINNPNEPKNENYPISKVEYYYKSDNYSGLGDVTTDVSDVEPKRLRNIVKTINRVGDVQENEIGVQVEATADFRENFSETTTDNIGANSNSFLVLIAPAIIPTFWPSFEYTTNQFRSATLTKVINRFGILDSTVATQDGSVVKTENLAYDSETGELLVSNVTTNFNDKVYSLNYPAHWANLNARLAYENIGFSQKRTDGIKNGQLTGVSALKQGDEIMISGEEEDEDGKKVLKNVKGWIISKTGDQAVVVDKKGELINFKNPVYLKVVRSGNRNKATESLGSVTSLSNPMNTIKSGNHVNVLNASAVVLSEEWRTYCNCFLVDDPKFSVNPYLTGIKGNWRPIQSLTYLSDRLFTSGPSTNIRRDGVYSLKYYYTPKPSGNANDVWNQNKTNWTSVSEVTEFSPNGMTLETKDALGRYSSSLFSFNSTMTSAVASNTRLRQLEFASFEDDAYTNCAKQGMFENIGNTVKSSDGKIEDKIAHSGYKSLKVEANKSIKFSKTDVYCTPKNGCDLSIVSTSDPTVLKVLEGFPTYEIETELLGGSGYAFVNTDNTIKLEYKKTSYFEMDITLRDSKNCVTTYKATFTPNN